MTSKITVVIEKDVDGYYAYAPELAGCQTQGDTLDEVLVNIQEAVELYLSTMTPEEIQAIYHATETGSLNVIASLKSN